MRRFLQISASLALLTPFYLAGTTASAQSTHLVEFAAYQTAFDSGDVDTAMASAEAAWQAAETELADDATTAVLAYNYARLAFVYAHRADSARRAYLRVLDLSEREIASFRPADIQIALAELGLISDPNPSDADRLQQLLWERRNADIAPTELSAHAWKSLATENLRQLERLAAAYHADIAAMEAESLQPADVDMASEAYLLSAYARLSDRHCVSSHQEITSAIRSLDRTIALASPLLADEKMAQRQTTALEWRDTAKELATKVRRARIQGQGKAKSWPGD